MRTKSVIRIEVSDSELDKTIQAYYGRDFSCVVDQEWDNDSSHDVRVESGPLDAWDQKRVEEFRASGRYSGSLQALMRDLCNAGVIDGGDYLVQVCW